MEMSDTDLMMGAAMEMAQVSSPYLSLDLTVQEALVALGAMQLALRHPYLAITVREDLRDLAEKIECSLSAAGPCVREIARRGWSTPAPLFAA